MPNFDVYISVNISQILIKNTDTMNYSTGAIKLSSKVSAILFHMFFTIEMFFTYGLLKTCFWFPTYISVFR